MRSQFASADKVTIPSIVLGELYFGAEKSDQVARNVARADSFARESGVLACDAGTARLYGIITSRLRVKGRPILTMIFGLQPLRSNTTWSLLLVMHTSPKFKT
ncbi:MAG TPA: hypothetical protein VF952_03435 [Chloroflexia bacterium]